MKHSAAQPTQLKCSLTSVLQDALAFTMASEPTMLNRPEPSHNPSPLHFAAVPAAVGQGVCCSTTGTDENDTGRFPAPSGGSITADPIVTIPRNFIW